MAFKSNKQRKAVMAKMKPKRAGVRAKRGPKKQKWFKEAIEEKPPYKLGGWEKRLPASIRRKRAFKSRPKHWSTRRKNLSAARALQALANVTTDEETKRIARGDAKYFFALAKG